MVGKISFVRNSTGQTAFSCVGMLLTVFSHSFAWKLNKHFLDLGLIFSFLTEYLFSNYSTLFPTAYHKLLVACKIPPTWWNSKKLCVCHQYLLFFSGILMLLDIPHERGFSMADKKWGNAELCHFPLIHSMSPLPYEWMCIVYSIMWIGTL